MVKVSCILFDLGGVLVNWNNSWLVEDISKKFQLSKTKLSEAFENNLEDYSSGKINELEFWHRIGKTVNSSELKKIEKSLYDEICSKRMSINYFVYGLSKKLKERGFSIGIISNTESVIFSLIEEMMPTEHFDYKFLSYKIGLVKPDKRLFEYVLEKLPYSKENLLYIDDCILNVHIAESLGIESIHYSSNEKFMSQLQTKNIV